MLSYLQFILETKDATKEKSILKNSLLRLASNSHIVSSQIRNNIDKFLNSLNINKLESHIGASIEKMLGYGVFGCVFKLSNGKVMKITFDYREAPFLYEYGFKNHKEGIVEIDSIYKIKFGDAFAYIIIRDPLQFGSLSKVSRVINDLKRGEDINYKDNDEKQIKSALEAMYDIDPDWRGTHPSNLAKQDGKYVLYDGFSKNVKLSDDNIPILNIG